MAEQFTADGKYNVAELMLRQAMELAGNDEVYAAGLATLIGMQSGRGNEAVKIIEEQLKKFPENPSLLCAYGLTAQTEGHQDEAEAFMRKALAKNQEHPLALYGLSTVLHDKGQMEEAEKMACKAFTLVPDHPGFAKTAIEFLEIQGKDDLAFEVAVVGAQFNPQDMELVQKAVEGALIRQEPERAWEALKESDEELSWVLGWKATLLDHSGQVEEANALLAVGRQKFWEDADYLILEAAIWIRRGNMEMVEELLERVLEIDPTNRTALKMRADHALELDDPELAVADLEALYQEDPDDAKVGLDLIRAYYKCRRYEDALDLCNFWEDQLKRNPELYVPPQLRVYSALAAAACGDGQTAMWRSDWIGDEYLVEAIGELNQYGGQQLAEDKLRNRLMERLPEPEQVNPFDTPTELDEDSPEMVSISSSTRLTAPQTEIDQDGEEWVWVDEDEELEGGVDEDGEEWVWVDEDEEEV